MMMFSKMDKRGFTLIELMIVMSIVGILASIAAPNFHWGLIKARESVLREQLYTFDSIIDQYYADLGKYPDTLQDLVPKYLPKIPKDPMTGSEDWDTDPPLSVEGLEVKGNVGRVKSKSTVVGTDGKPYFEW
jgi:general secretion pathway protein G